jgi:thiamine pyrophosphate-dependent acetolactate synthase large subunit-like protein
MNGGDLVVSGLIAHGVDTVFGIPGVHNLELYRGIAATGLRHCCSWRRARATASSATL